MDRLDNLEIECINNSYLEFEDQTNVWDDKEIVLQLYLGITDKDLLPNDKKYDWLDYLRAVVKKDDLPKIIEWLQKLYNKQQ